MMVTLSSTLTPREPRQRFPGIATGSGRIDAEQPRYVWQWPDTPRRRACPPAPATSSRRRRASSSRQGKTDAVPAAIDAPALRTH